MKTPHAFDDPDRLARAALRLANEIDQDRSEALWSRASARALAGMPPPEFANGARQLRAGQGALLSRTLHDVLRNPTDPCLRHIVSHSRFASWTGEEMITLELESDGVWRLAGYAARPLDVA